MKLREATADEIWGSRLYRRAFCAYLRRTIQDWLTGATVALTEKKPGDFAQDDTRLWLTIEKPHYPPDEVARNVRDIAAQAGWSVSAEPVDDVRPGTARLMVVLLGRLDDKKSAARRSRLANADLLRKPRRT